jgi:hypothetical protein
MGTMLRHFDVSKKLTVKLQYLRCYHGPAIVNFDPTVVVLRARLRNPRGVEKVVAEITAGDLGNGTGCHKATVEVVLLSLADVEGRYTFTIDSNIYVIRNKLLRTSGHPRVLLTVDGINVSGDQPQVTQLNRDEPYVAAWQFRFEHSRVDTKLLAPVAILTPLTGNSAHPGARCGGAQGKLTTEVSGNDVTGADKVHVGVFPSDFMPDNEPPASIPEEQRVLPDGDNWKIDGGTVLSDTCDTTNTQQKIVAWAEYFAGQGSIIYDKSTKLVWIQSE